MKRIILASASAAALTFAAGSAMAQSNTSAITQGGASQQAEVAQSGSLGNSTISQSGADNWVRVGQGSTGTNNTATVTQVGDDVPPAGVPQTDDPYSYKLSNIADIQQNGNNGTATVNQTGNNRASVSQAYAPGSGQVSSITQRSYSLAGGSIENYAATGQRGDNVSSEITQDGDLNRAVTSQMMATNSDSDISQDGDSNDASVSQTGFDAQSTIFQTGNENVALVGQSGSNLTSRVTQSGSEAAATVNQSGSNSDSTITQLSGGEVTVNQSGSRGSVSTVTTEADSRLAPPANTVVVTQTDSGTGPSGQANASTVIQDNVNLGSSVIVGQSHNIAGEEQNTSFVRQGRNASNGDVSVSQTGGDNVSSYTSTTATDNDANIVQTGANNNSDVQQDFQNGGALANVTQNGTGGAENNVFIDQISAGFATNPAQFALGASASATQNGSGNLSTISQTGFADTAIEANFASSSQTGDLNTSLITQSGVDNIASLTQTGSSHVSTILQTGDANTANVTQSSNGNSSIVTQGGTGNTATVSQGGSSF